MPTTVPAAAGLLTLATPSPGRRTPTRSLAAASLAFSIALSIALAISLAGCSGPRLYIDNPEDHLAFVDGQRTVQESLAYRYYGTSRWSSLPRIPEVHGVPDFDQSPEEGTVVIEPPASAWLFPLDFPLEVASWLIHGQQDQTVTIVARPKQPEQRVGQQISGEKLSQLSARARQARIAR